MKSKVVDVGTAVSKIKDNDTILFSGFYARGTAPDVIDEILKQGQKDLAVVTNDGGWDHAGTGKLVRAGIVKKFTCSWCGRTPIIPELDQKGDLSLELVPQGSLCERIRAGGYGLGGVLTKAGLDTIIEERWGEKVTLNGEDWLYQTPIRGNVTVLEAWEADEFGNLIFKNTQRNFSTVMAYASDIVIASVINPIVKVGSLDPEKIMVPGVIVDYVFQQKGV